MRTGTEWCISASFNNMQLYNIWDEHCPLKHNEQTLEWIGGMMHRLHSHRMTNWFSDTTHQLSRHTNCHSDMTHQLSQWHDTPTVTVTQHTTNLSQWHDMSPHLVQFPPPSLLSLQLGEIVVVGHQLRDDGLLVWTQDIHVWGEQHMHTVWCDQVTITWSANMESIIQMFHAQLVNSQILVRLNLVIWDCFTNGVSWIFCTQKTA